MTNFGHPRNGPWEKIFAYAPVMVEEKLRWWEWVERRWVVGYATWLDRADNKTTGWYEWRMPHSPTTSHRGPVDPPRRSS